MNVKYTYRYNEVQNRIEAYYNNANCGYIDFDVCKYDFCGNEITVAHPHTANVDESHQRKGVGTAMIKYAKGIFNEVVFERDSGSSGMKDTIHYSDAGLRLKQHCEANGITRDVDSTDDWED